MWLKFQYILYTSILSTYAFIDAANTTAGATVEEFNTSTGANVTGGLGKDKPTSGHGLGHGHEKTLLLTQMIFKYGDRSPIYPYEGNPWKHYNYGTVGKALGQITCTGKQQMDELAAYVRLRYKGFIPNCYDSDDIYVQSSNFDRAIVSVSRFLSALYLPVQGGGQNRGGSNHNSCVCVGSQTVPYHTISPSLDNKIAMTARCPRFEHLYAEFQASHIVKEINAKLDRFAVSAAVSGQPYKKIPYMVATDLYDTLSIQKIYNLSWPHWAAKFIHHAKECAELQRISEVYTPELQRFKAWPLITEIYKNMLVNHWQDRHSFLTVEEILAYRKAKFYVYAGHDTTIAHFLYTLGMFGGRIPGYAAAVFIELYLFHGELIVEILYKADWEARTVHLDIPGCQKPCSLKKFRDLISNFIIDDKTWAAECSKGKEQVKN